MGEAPAPPADPPPDAPSTPARPTDGNKALITAVVIGILVLAGLVAWPLLGAEIEPDPSSPAAVPSLPATTAPTAAAASSPTSATPLPSDPASEPAPSDTEAQDKDERVTALHSDLDDLAGKKVLDYRLRDRQPVPYIDNLGGDGERLVYRRKGATVFQVNGLFADSDAAQAALHRRFRRLTRDKNAEVEFDEPLRDTGDNDIGRIFSVITRGGKRMVTWSNSNLLVTIGPGRPRLMERWYQALPY